MLPLSTVHLGQMIQIRGRYEPLPYASWEHVEVAMAVHFLELHKSVCLRSALSSLLGIWANLLRFVLVVCPSHRPISDAKCFVIGSCVRMREIHETSSPKLGHNLAP